MPSPFPCSPVIRECSWKKTQVEKKKKKIFPKMSGFQRILNGFQRILPCKIKAFSPNFLVIKFSVNGQFLQIFWPIREKICLFPKRNVSVYRVICRSTHFGGPHQSCTEKFHIIHRELKFQFWKIFAVSVSWNTSRRHFEQKKIAI